MKKIKRLRIQFILSIFILVSLSRGLSCHLPGIPAQTTDEPVKILEKYFESKGFSGNKVEIPELDITVDLKDNHFYKKETGITNVYRRINELRRSFGLPVPYSHKVRGYGWCGVLDAEYLEKKAKGYVVLIKKGLNRTTLIYTTAHENGHFLWYVNQQDTIYQKFEKPDLIKSQIKTNSEFAELCGWLGVKLAGIQLEGCTILKGANTIQHKDINRIKQLVENNLKE